MPIPPFHPNARVPVPAPTLPSSTAPSLRRGDRRSHVVGPHVQPANVVEAAVVGFADERVDGSHVGVAVLLQRPLHQPFDRGADAQRVGQRDRRFDRAELVDLRRARELAEGVADEHRAGHLLLKHVAGVRHDDGHAGANGVAGDERRVADAHAGDIGDGVERAPARTRPARARYRARADGPAARTATAAHTATRSARPSECDMVSMIRSALRMRQIPLSAIQDAATSVYQAAIRTPLVRLDLPLRRGR